MKVLVACEFSGVVRDSFRALGHDAWSCDVVPCWSNPKFHLWSDVFDVLGEGWDLMIAFPPCTHLAVSGARHFHRKAIQQRRAVQFVDALWNAPIPRIAIENPVGVLSTLWRRPEQTIQPWQFGHGETKRTCLWLKNLPLLAPTNVVAGRVPRVHRLPPSPDRAALRSVTYPGIASAMALQWSLEQLDLFAA